MRTWKHAERVLAKLVGGERIPVSGRAGQPDIRHPWLAVEVKHRKALPQWLLHALGQAEQAARPDQLPIAVLHQHGQPYRESLVLLRLRDFQAWFGWPERSAAPPGLRNAGPGEGGGECSSTT